MKFKYCPQCAALDIKRLPNGSEECLRCHYVGSAREGAMNEINSYKQQLKAGGVRVPPSESAGKSSNSQVSSAAIQEKLKGLKGTSTDDFEIL